MLEAKCIMQCFDNDKGILYYPGDMGEIDLDSDVSICFDLSADDRRTALELMDKRSKARKAEQVDMKKSGFENLYQYRKFKAATAHASPAD